MAKKTPPLVEEEISGNTPRVRVSQLMPDGHLVRLGDIAYVYKRHIRQFCWEATGMDGHRGMHERREQAVKALQWNGVGYPFPLT